MIFQANHQRLLSGNSCISNKPIKIRVLKGKSIRAIAKEVGISVGRTHKVCSSLSI